MHNKILLTCFIMLNILCFCGCKNNKIKTKDLPENIETQYEYQIRKGETISFKYPSYSDLPSTFDLSKIFDEDLKEYDIYTLEGKNTNKLTFVDYNGYGQLTCLDEFKDDVIITGLLKKTNKTNVFIKFPCSITVHYSDLSLNDECLFPTSFCEQTQNGNGPSEMIQMKPGWNPGSEANVMYFYLNPSLLSTEKAKYDIVSCESLNSKISIDSVQYYCYDAETSLNDFSKFQYKALPASSEWSEGKGYLPLILKFTFSDKINNESSFTGGSIKFKVKLDGDEYDIYRDVHYRRLNNWIAE